MSKLRNNFTSTTRCKKRVSKSPQRDSPQSQFIISFGLGSKQNGSVSRNISSRLHNAMQKSIQNTTQHGTKINRNKLWFLNVLGCSHMEKKVFKLFMRNCDYTLFSVGCFQEHKEHIHWKRMEKCIARLHKIFWTCLGTFFFFRFSLVLRTKQ